MTDHFCILHHSANTLKHTNITTEFWKVNKATFCYFIQLLMCFPDTGTAWISLHYSISNQFIMQDI